MAAARQKIAFIIDAYTPGAGTENQLRGILKNLDKSQHDATLITLRKPVSVADQQDLGWPCKCLWVDKLAHIASLFKFVSFVFWLRRAHFDIAMIYFQDSRLFAVPACRLGGVRLIVSNRRDMGYWRTRALSRALRFVDRLSHRCLVNSEAVKRSVIEHEHYPPDKITVIYNGLWEQEKAPSIDVTKASLGFDHDCAVVGIVANLRPVKRIDRFIEMAAIVAAEVPRARFLIIGRGDLEPALREQVGRLRLDQHVVFLGQVLNVAGHLALCDVGVLTSESEGLSNALIEYAASGVPAVAFTTGGNPEVIQDALTGFLAPNGDIPALAGKVVALLSDNELRQQMARRSRERIAERFSPDKIMRELIAFWDAISLDAKRR